MPTPGSSSPLLLHDLPSGLRSSFFWRSGAILGQYPVLSPNIRPHNEHALWRRTSLHSTDHTLFRLAAAGMLSGAFGAHALKRRPGVTADNIHAWETASQYAVRSLSAHFA
jgi:hypothetical protein